MTSTPTNGNPHLYSLTIHNHPHAIFGDGEFNVLFYWANDDVIRDAYSLEYYNGTVADFANQYEIRREFMNDNDYLPKIPRIESLLYDDSDYRCWNHIFHDPNQIVEIFYKQYTR